MSQMIVSPSLTLKRIEPCSFLKSRLLSALRMIGSRTLTCWASNTIFRRFPVPLPFSSRANFCTCNQSHDSVGSVGSASLACSYKPVMNESSTEVNCITVLAEKPLPTVLLCRTYGEHGVVSTIEGIQQQNCGSSA